MTVSTEAAAAADASAESTNTGADSAATEASTDEAEEETGSVTPEEVAKALRLPTPAKQEATEDKTNTEETDSTEEEEAAEEEVDDETEEETTDDVEEPTTTTDAPDLSLEVEDANGKKFTLKPGDDLEKVLEDFEPKSNGQIMKILDDFRKLGDQQSAYEAEQETQAAEAARTERIEAVKSGWDKEIATLQGNKRLPVTTDGKPSERINQVFQFIREQNEQRQKDGRPLLESFEDALDKLELRESKDEAVKKAKEEKELARKKGSIVGGSSAPASSGAPVYKGGPARNANEVLRSMGMLK